ncbi:MAG: transcription elongation factor GreA [Candidatus Buchananbacteria bacterium RIFCSPHIGHO2_02_FULL_40_13]|uniref:Transcription elongation factor GreA n=1 Tax=Candidatus Buchananbacteria bacterium RIFCSPLOWO2_01_FULL_39_33 TaxID=1797543 RepID=A0A1G1YH04_9BACT|nr:MAG: transcription elongation factor GreA [Candidatus Buchananbacteria bacterium RIFCSPHIGHO2_01_FULL_40_35]OGY50449.1 MAG: transcription elongation factor GreA [Candidatus Buchananbacteria bacterium RIFCSPHIGHO2_02_FULL_40_13]OGY51589.1 MAG: transcription elongation factor GreA [Candidatus Buchananbacteria bacterium RIFCSPLOWO2_01_FULL_39_33]
MKENYISKEGLKKLQEELEELKNIKRPLTVEKITRARDQGDLSENAEYHEAREEQSFIEGKIQELEYLIKNSIVIKSDKKSEIIGLGSTVHATCDNGTKLKYTIVGPTEADPAQGKISHESPLGRAFIGKSVGHEFELVIPAGKLKCKIDKVE